MPTIIVLIKVQAKSPEAAREICRTNLHAFARYQHPGWIRGRCAVSTSDPLLVIAIQEWSIRPAFDSWFNSPAKAQHEELNAPFVAGPHQFEVFEEM
jgi:heme-degrading monooxygenase HmoA